MLGFLLILNQKRSMDLNKIILIGHLTNDPQERQLPSGQKVVSFGLATNLVWRDAKTNDRREAVEFHRVVNFSTLGQRAMEHLQKGARVYVEGRLRQRSWKDKQGQTHQVQEVSMSELIFLSGHKREAREVVEEVITDESPDESVEQAEALS